ncbi:MAG: outer membrane lipoprotein carrier protein LolA [Bacteroidaceae bacterium]|nr:outer membrane lipoprotein carrier protein LolA [Bacteroidaceae bacterium]
MKRLFFFSLLCLLNLPLWAQKPVSIAEQKQMVGQIEKAVANLKTLQCDFRQVKHLSLLDGDMKSQGHMYYKGGDRLRWEYATPYKYCFVLNKDKVMMRGANDKLNVVDVRSSRLFQEITRIMMNSITGKCLSSKTDFSVTMYRHDGEWEARLVPQKKEMKRMFSLITLHIDVKTKMVIRVEMKETTGDTTMIYLENPRQNLPINDNVFGMK